MSRPPSSFFLSRLVRAPAVRALLIQCAAAPLTLALAWLLARFQFPVNYLSAAVLQGVLAAAITWRLALAPWWRAIQLLFPLALLTTLALQLPPWIFLVIFLALLGWYWSTFRTQVPYYPSHAAVWDAVRRQLPPPQVGKRLRVVDIGSGLGGFVLYLARTRPDVECVGIELAPLPWVVSWLRARLSGTGRSTGRAVMADVAGGATGDAGAPLRPRFLRGDYEQLDFSQFDLVFAYLSPAAMDGLWRKAQAEMSTGSALISYEFAIDGREADLVIHATDDPVPLYKWYF